MTRRALWLLPALLPCLASCVHEFPETGENRTVSLLVTHDTDWTQYDMFVSRAAEYSARYHFMICRPGNTDGVLEEVEFTSDDLQRGDFYTSLSLPPGSYELWAWSDYADGATARSMFFNTGDFKAIGYSEPYNGNNELRDAFRGHTSITVEANTDAAYTASATLPMERLMSRYEFISTDLAKFLENELVQKDGRNTPSRVEDIDLSAYRVKMIYTGYMPSEFNNFINRPFNSRTGVTYEATISRLNDDEARLGFDYVMVNGHESSIPVALEVYDPAGKLIARTNSVDVPIMRSRNTSVRGRFLTSLATGGVGIDPSFDGDYNIEIK